MKSESDARSEPHLLPCRRPLQCRPRRRPAPSSRRCASGGCAASSPPSERAAVTARRGWRRCRLRALSLSESRSKRELGYVALRVAQCVLGVEPSACRQAEANATAFRNEDRETSWTRPQPVEINNMG